MKEELYHIKFFSVLPGKQQEAIEIQRELCEVAKKAEGVEFLGLFYPRGSSYMFARITKHKSYAAWEEFWWSPTTVKARTKGGPIAVKEEDMFFEEVKME